MALATAAFPPLTLHRLRHYAHLLPAFATVLLLAAGAAPVGPSAGAGDREAWATDS